MPDEANGRVTLAVLGEKVDTMTAVMRDLRDEMREMRGHGDRIGDRVTVLEVCVKQNADHIAANRAIRRESRAIDTVIGLAAAYAALHSFMP